jgi:hypothetical protein
VTGRRSLRAPVVGVVAVAVLAAIVVAIVATRPSKHRPGTDAGTRPTTAGASTTVPEPVVAVGAPVASTVPPASPQATSVPAAGPALTGAGAVLSPPAAAVTHPAPTAGCGDLADQGWTLTSCGTAGAAPLTLTWVVEALPAGPLLGHRVTVWRPATAGQYEVALVAADDHGTVWSDVRAAVAPVSAAGGQQLLVGFHVIATKALVLDLVDSPGRVVMHRVEAGGSAVASPGQLDAWAASPTAREALVHEVIRNSDGVWRVVLSTRAVGGAPASQV